MTDDRSWLRVLSEGDDVAVVMHEGHAIPVGHKVALRDIASGEAVHKYRHIIGYASADIAEGEHVHTHNLVFGTHEAPEAPVGDPRASDLPAVSGTTFLGYRRSDGRVATRNVIAIVSTVNCSATVCHQIATAVERAGILEQFEHVDAVVPVTHGTGCGIAAGPNLDRLRRTLAGYAGHTNVGGLITVSLGCEVNQMTEFMTMVPRRDDLPIVKLTMQEMGGTRATIERGVEAVRQLAAQINDVERVEVGLEHLILGLNCGGSDGWSGITANPALGVASDIIVAHGGRSVLAETPEIYGAEDLLIDRAVTQEVADEFRGLISRWEADVALTGDSLDNNPSPGNKAGGITTILEKSLGAASKSGHAPLAAVYEYAEEIDTPGLGFMDTPGYDPVSVTGLIAGGANVVCFTTGRGSALGYGIVPVLKVATNTELYLKMPDDMDLNAGDVVTDDVTLDVKGVEIFERLIAVASGEPTKSEELGYGTQEFVPWLQGPVF